MSACCDEKPGNGNANVPPVSWCAGNYALTYDKGRVVKLPIPNPIPDGIYTNPTITLQDGCIVSIENGDNVLYSACDPCATPVVPPDPGAVAIDGNACNLSSESSEGILTLLFTGMNSCVALAGCGTYLSPLTASLIISPDAGNAVECRPNGLYVADPSATSGASFIGCGITISNGLVVELPLPFQPVLSLISSDASVLISRDPSNPCIVDIRANADTILDVNTSRAYQFDTVGDLTPTPNGNGLAVVGTVNPRDVYLYVDQAGWRQMVGVTVNV